MNLTPTAVVVKSVRSSGYEVTTVWTSTEVVLDRPSTFSMLCVNLKLAIRFASAVNAGKVFSDPKVKTDTNGKTYVEAPCKIMGRYLNSDLKKIGY